MDMKINKPEDLRPGDKWLGMTVNTKDADDDRQQQWFEGHILGITHNSIQTLIDAGHNEVGREPVIVEYRTTVERKFPPYSNLSGLNECGNPLYPFPDGTYVHVAVSKEPFVAIPGEEIVAEGEYEKLVAKDSYFGIYDVAVDLWCRQNAKPGDKVVIVGGGS